MLKPRGLRDAVVIELLVLFIAGSGVCAAISAKPAADQLLNTVPAGSLFCIRVNNFNYTLNQIDQFLAGVSPVPMGASMLVRMQFAQVLGSPELKGVDMDGSFALFGGVLPGESAQNDPVSNIFVGGLVPVADYRQFISGNPNCSQPDDKGVSRIRVDGGVNLLATQAGNYALVGWGNDYDKLVAMAKTISAAGAAGLSGSLDAAESKLAADKPIWAYGNVQQAAENFGPMLLAKIEEAKSMITMAEPNRPAEEIRNTQNVMNTFAGIAETLMKETRSFSIAIDPKPSVLNITNSITAVPDTDMADMFSSDASAERENELLKYLEDGAVANFGLRMGTPFWEKLTTKSVDLLGTIASANMTAEDTAKMKALATDLIDSVGGSIAGTVSMDAGGKPPFAARYVIAVKDEAKFNKFIAEATQMLSNEGIAGLDKDMGVETSFMVKRGVDTYRGVSIDSGKLTMKSTDAGSPQGQMISGMYGEGFDYRWALVDGLCVSAMGGDVNSAIRQMIDQVKAGGPKQIGAELNTALGLLPDANKADFVATYNLLRLFRMIATMAPLPMPQMEIPTKSNIIAAGKVGEGRVVLDIAVPKEHLAEVMGGVLMMQQQMMQPQQGQTQPTP